MKMLRNICAVALVALPVVSIAATAEAGPRQHGGYSNHRGYTQHNRGYVRHGYRVRRKAWFGRMHLSRRHGSGWNRAH